MSVNSEPRQNPVLRSILEDVALKHQGSVFVVDMDPETNGMMQYFGFDYDQLPILFFVDMENPSWKKYVYHGEIEAGGINHFYTDAMMGNLYPYYKSEPIYEHLDGFVKVIVSKDFDDVAYDPYKNVLVEYVVPVMIGGVFDIQGCRMCDRVADDYQRLAETYINTDDVVIARVDTSKNDIHDFVFGEFPTFILYKAGGDGEKSVVFSGEQMDYPVRMERVSDQQRLKKFVDDFKTIAPKRPKSIDMGAKEEEEVKV